MMDLFWTPEAVADRLSIYTYIEADNPRAAIALDEDFAAYAKRLCDHPLIGRRGRVEGTRECVVRGSYVIVYAVLDDRIHIVRVLHTARLWPQPKP